MVKILVTGGAGQIGAAFIKLLLKDSMNFVVVVDNLSTGKMSNLPAFPQERLSFFQIDVNNYEKLSKVMRQHNFTYVFHYAAVVGVQRTLTKPLAVLKDIDGIKNILHLSKITGVKRIYYASSSEVYGHASEFPQNENTTPLNATLPYAIVKSTGEAYLKAYHQLYGLEYTIFRFFNTYGPRQSTDFVIPRFVEAALNHQTLFLYGDGSQTRTFCYVSDNAQACYNIFKKEIYVNDVVNIGSNDEVSIYRVAKMIIQAAGSSSEIVVKPPLKQGDTFRRLPDNTKMKHALAKELIPVERGIEKIIRHKIFSKKIAR
ncbi:NAD-dependent epimerase/dehydratase family protein [Foetidibacter luteolus]|uniref:NAD-dependent epimerase/dehydratase family protein n=1 Tax=Foetidibacter luteolus TaxID=2608880 RepID=UPI00129BD20C|nr:NAD-dependent epimerase/dehydratase family protein [Foetidibacter luteolus]